MGIVITSCSKCDLSAPFNPPALALFSRTLDLATLISSDVGLSCCICENAVFKHMFGSGGAMLFIKHSNVPLLKRGIIYYVLCVFEIN